MKRLPPVTGDIPAPTEQEQALLVSLWNSLAPAKYRGLLEAENLSILRIEKRRPKGRFIWDESKRRYAWAKTGKYLKPAEVRAAFVEFMKARAKR